MPGWRGQRLYLRCDAVELHGQAKASRAVLALGAIIERTPLPVRAISVDSGAEFMAGFADV